MVDTIPTSGTWSAIAGLLNGNFTEITSVKTVWISQNNAAQAPTSVDAPITVDWGTPTVNTGEVSIASGVATFNETGVYLVDASLQVGRLAASGAATIVIRTLLNGSQNGDSSFFTIDSAADNRLFTDNPVFAVSAAGTTYELELYRDSTGNNDGGLYPFSPTLAGWADASSAELRILKLNTVP